jgi:hypothetical protein
MVNDTSPVRHIALPLKFRAIVVHALAPTRQAALRWWQLETTS